MTKKILSVVLMCCLISSCGRREPFLAASVTYDEADTEAHVMELTSLYPPPCISLTEILLAAGLVTAAVLVNIYLYRRSKAFEKLWGSGRQEVQVVKQKLERKKQKVQYVKQKLMQVQYVKQKLMQKLGRKKSANLFLRWRLKTANSQLIKAKKLIPEELRAQYASLFKELQDIRLKTIAPYRGGLQENIELRREFLAERDAILSHIKNLSQSLIEANNKIKILTRENEELRRKQRTGT
jgi:hypothetical protein